MRIRPACCRTTLLQLQQGLQGSSVPTMPSSTATLRHKQRKREARKDHGTKVASCTSILDILACSSANDKTSRQKLSRQQIIAQSQKFMLAGDGSMPLAIVTWICTARTGLPCRHPRNMVLTALCC